MKHPRTIKKHLRELRRVIDHSSDPVERRMASCIEMAVRWTTEKTNGWPGLAKESIIQAKSLKIELSSLTVLVRNG